MKIQLLAFALALLPATTATAVTVKLVEGGLRASMGSAIKSDGLEPINDALQVNEVYNQHSSPGLPRTSVSNNYGFTNNSILQIRSAAPFEIASPSVTNVSIVTLISQSLAESHPPGTEPRGTGAWGSITQLSWYFEYEIDEPTTMWISAHSYLPRLYIDDFSNYSGPVTDANLPVDTGGDEALEVRINGARTINYGSIALAAGVNRLEFRSLGIITSAKSYSSGTDEYYYYASASNMAIWSINGFLPGTTPNAPVAPPQVGPIPILIDDEFDQLEPINTPYPVETTSSPVYFGLPTKLANGDCQCGRVIGFEVDSGTVPMTSFIVPTLPPGLSSLTIDFGAGPQVVQPDTVFNFAMPGVTGFVIGGFDPTQADFAMDAFVMGITFDQTGLVTLASKPVLLSPPGDFNGNGIVNAADYLVWRSNFGSTANLAADANGNGEVDASDYVIWRKNICVPPVITATSVPEPSSFHIVALLALAQLCQRRTSK